MTNPFVSTVQEYVKANPGRQHGTPLRREVSPGCLLFFVRAFLALATLMAPVAFAAESRWVLATAIPESETVRFFYIDRATFKGGANPLFWAKGAVCTLEEPVQCKLSFLRIKSACNGRLFAVLSSRDLDENGDEISRQDNGNNVRLSPAFPDSIIENVLDFACTEQKKILSK